MDASSSDYGIIVDANECPKTTEYPTLPSNNSGDTCNDSSHDLDSDQTDRSLTTEGEVDSTEVEIQPDNVDLTELTTTPV